MSNLSNCHKTRIQIHLSQLNYETFWRDEVLFKTFTEFCYENRTSSSYFFHVFSGYFGSYRQENPADLKKMALKKFR